MGKLKEQVCSQLALVKGLSVHPAYHLVINNTRFNDTFVIGIICTCAHFSQMYFYMKHSNCKIHDDDVHKTGESYLLAVTHSNMDMPT